MSNENKLKLMTVLLFIIWAFAGLAFALAEERNELKVEKKHHLSKELYKCNQCNYMHRAILLNN